MKKIFSSIYSKLIYSIFFIIVIQLIGSFFTKNNLEWYRYLEKPPLTPPNYIFGPIWAILYLMIAISFWKIWINNSNKKKSAYGFFFLQIFFNVSWTFCFFYLQNPLLGLLDIILLDIFIIFTLIYFVKISVFSAIMLIPYTFWTLYASYLNLGFWILN